jgi:small subunit ribosomal protein S17
MSQATQTQSATQTRKALKSTRYGVVTSDKRDKTRTVQVEFSARHAKYGKFLRRATKFQVHDPSNDAKQGDRVEIARCRPISKTKSWRLVRVIERAPEA